MWPSSSQPRVRAQAALAPVRPAGQQVEPCLHWPCCAGACARAAAACNTFRAVSRPPHTAVRCMSEKRTREKAGGAGAGPSEHPAKRPHEAAEPSCPFLHTVDRSRLDFDSQHVCSVTMSPVNVYACLVCGSFFRGKSASTPAHAHALDSGHQVFMRLKDGTAWCLPGETSHPLLQVPPPLSPGCARCQGTRRLCPGQSHSTIALI